MDLAQEIPALQSLPPEVREMVLRFILFFMAVAVIWILRRIIAWMIIRPLRILVGRTRYEFDNLLVDAMLGPMRYVVIAVGIQLTVTVLDFGTAVTTFAGLLARTMLIVALFYAVYKLFRVISVTPNEVLRFTGITIEERLLPFMRTVIQVSILLLGMILILQEWGFEVGGLIASLGVVGLAFSLAAQDTVSNFFGFTAIVADSPFNVGEFIKTPDVTGIVEHVGVRSTRVRQLDQALVTVPNSKLAAAAVLNWSRLEKRRLNFTLGLTYSTTSAQMRALLERLRSMLAARETVDAESVIVNFTDFGDSSLNVLIICYVMLPDWGEYTNEKEKINLDIMEIVEELGLSIAFPSRSIYVEAIPGFVAPEEPVKIPAMRPIPAAPSAQESKQAEGTADVEDQISEEAPETK